MGSAPGRRPYSSGLPPSSGVHTRMIRFQNINHPRQLFLNFFKGCCVDLSTLVLVPDTVDFDVIVSGEV
jgi:hypothetical protein